MPAMTWGGAWSSVRLHEPSAPTESCRFSCQEPALSTDAESCRRPDPYRHRVRCEKFVWRRSRLLWLQKRDRPTPPAKNLPIREFRRSKRCWCPWLHPSARVVSRRRQRPRPLDRETAANLLPLRSRSGAGDWLSGSISSRSSLCHRFLEFEFPTTLFQREARG